MTEIDLEVFYGVTSPWAYLGAPLVDDLAEKYSFRPNFRPIVLIQENGGIPLRTRPQARQDYHLLETQRWAQRRGVRLTPKPRYYPLPPRGIEVPAHAIIRAQHALGRGHPTMRAFSYAIQRALWAEERDIADVQTVREVALSVGISPEQAEAWCADRRDDEADAAVQEYRKNLADAQAIGIFGTPTYVLNGELFWGQDQLPWIEERIQEILGSKQGPQE